ncbi:MAG: hypothetical protein CM15mP62_06530 [Rhodospirillaceae bacterium]|nr:MAG: hypothetical protein CM15mP62_06530 [Rhodospirillaceae bacterium]
MLKLEMGKNIVIQDVPESTIARGKPGIPAIQKHWPGLKYPSLRLRLLHHTAGYILTMARAAIK